MVPVGMGLSCDVSLPMARGPMVGLPLAEVCRSLSKIMQLFSDVIMSSFNFLSVCKTIDV